MRNNLIFLSCLLLVFFMCQCDNTFQNDPSLLQAENSHVVTNEEVSEIDQLGQDIIDAMNKEALNNAQKLKFSDSDFLQTKQPMSHDAIALVDYHTGLVGDKAYNNVVYINALNRAKKQLSIQNGKLVLNVNSGQEINVAEDLFQFIKMVIDSWNVWIGEGKFEIVQTDEGSLDISPIISENIQFRSSPIDLIPLNHVRRYEEVKAVVDRAPVGTFIHEHFVLNFGTSLLSGKYTGNDSKIRKYSVSDGCGPQNPDCVYNRINNVVDVYDALYYIYSLRNSNHQSLASYQIQK